MKTCWRLHPLRSSAATKHFQSPVVVVMNQSKNLRQMDFSTRWFMRSPREKEGKRRPCKRLASWILKARFRVCKDLNLRLRLWSIQPPTAPQPLSWKTAAHMNAFSGWDHSLTKHPLPFLVVGSTESSSANHCPNLLLGALFLPAISEGGIQSSLRSFYWCLREQKISSRQIWMFLTYHLFKGFHHNFLSSITSHTHTLLKKSSAGRTSFKSLGAEHIQECKTECSFKSWGNKTPEILKS